MIPHHLATAKWFYSHGVETLFLIAIIFTLIGFFFGFLLWRHYACQVKRIQIQNTKLKDKKSILEAHEKKLTHLIQEASR